VFFHFRGLMKRSRGSRPLATLAVLAGLAAYGCEPGDEGSTLRRGDQAFARDSLEEALAEYRLAVRQAGEDADVLGRVGHTYATLRRVDEAADFYARAAEKDERWADLGAADLVHLAREAALENDPFLMASAMEVVRTLRPGVTVPELTLPLARHYFQTGEYGRALPLYQRALSEERDSLPSVVLEIGQAHEQIGDCPSALVFFERYRGLVRPGAQGEADWYIGNCSFQVARELRDRGGDTALEEALRHVNRTLEMGEPRNLLGQAWFEKGEILSELGDCDGSLEAFSQVRYYEPSSSSALVRRAQQRFDEIRFGSGLRELRGRCG